MISIIHPSRDVLEFVSYRRFKPCTRSRFVSPPCASTTPSEASSETSSSA